MLKLTHYRAERGPALTSTPVPMEQRLAPADRDDGNSDRRQFVHPPGKLYSKPEVFRISR
jgi:hypothetical protein